VSSEGGSPGRPNERLVSSTTHTRRTGSIMSEVPVQPVCPYAMGRAHGCCAWNGSSGQNAVQPSVRRPAPGCWRSSSRTVAGRRMRTPSSSPSPAIMAANRARSSAVEKSPAFPVTPPSSRANRSLGRPRNGSPLRSISVGAHRVHSCPGAKAVEVMPSGRHTFRSRYAGSGSPATRSAAVHRTT